MTKNEATLLDKCLRYRRALIAVMEKIPDITTPECVAASALLGEDYGREGRCLFDEEIV